MDARFQPAIRAIKAGDIQRLRSLLKEDPTLATSHSSRSHPTLIQWLTLDAQDVPNKVEMAQVLIDAGAEIHGPLRACPGIHNAEFAVALIAAASAIKR